MYNLPMELKKLDKSQIENLAKNIGCNPEHLKKCIRGERPFSKKLAEKIEKATFGVVKKENLLWPDKS